MTTGTYTEMPPIVVVCIQVWAVSEDQATDVATEEIKKESK